MYKYNGEKWYKAPAWYKRLRRWFIWIGGWEKANCSGWHLRYREKVPKYTSQTKDFAKGMNVSELEEYYKTHPYKMKTRFWYTPTPISLFGHRITIQDFGIYLSTRNRGYLVWNWNDKKCYVSPNGTPSNAIKWYFGTPKEIINEIKVRNINNS
ncbi:hypothetical protein QUW36_01805 [Clostridium cadaveris]|uniref:hypothetical protein n=1 Tax=Clostridium cadaveris TaxID=1529 RepID=UPI0025A3FF64|nr:hypothetical protein [Clostridium cadaveris]MDM8310783.1 hypothetical protein [Clostridium cadaveris]